jgi:hypothetical protein
MELLRVVCELLLYMAAFYPALSKVWTKIVRKMHFILNATWKLSKITPCNNRLDQKIHFNYLSSTGLP